MAAPTPTKSPTETETTETSESGVLSKTEIEWNHALEQLLCDEAEKCAGLAWLHGKSELYFSKQHNRLQIPMIILSTIVGAASVGSGSLFPGASGVASVSLGAISILVSILGLLNTHYAFGKRAEGHKLGSVQYAQIHRMIHIEMSLPRPQRMSPKGVLRYIKDDLKRLMETLPRVPENIIEDYKVSILKTASPNVSHPDITNGIHKVEAFVTPDEIPSSPTMEPRSPLTVRVVN
jgi:hypothetical protein